MEKIILRVKNLTVRLRKDNSLILNNISFDLKPGDVFAIEGRNGSGKSTLLRVLFLETADYKIDSGEIYYYPFSNKNILSFNDKEILKYRSSVGYVSQKDEYADLNLVTVEDLIIDAAKATQANKDTALELFHSYFKDSEKVKLNSIPGKLSGGEQRMVSIFLGLVCRNETSLMIIDEQLNNLNFNNVMRVSDLLNDIHRNNKNAAMIMITHCKIITCVNRQRRMKDGVLEDTDSNYECHHCMGEPDDELYYLKR